MSFKNPQCGIQLNPFRTEPLTPKNSRVIKQVQGNIENMSLPSLMMTNGKFLSISPGGYQSSELKEALTRMRNGTALQRLKQQRELTYTRDENEPINGLHQLSVNELTDKGSLNPSIQLGRQESERRMSGLARSA